MATGWIQWASYHAQDWLEHGYEVAIRWLNNGYNMVRESLGVSCGCVYKGFLKWGYP